MAYAIRLYIGLHYSSSTIADSDATSYTVEYLAPCRNDYAFSIAVINEAGVGDFSPPLLIAVQPGMYVCM